ncbi:MAG: nuclear transport factor 2 family protein [Acidimicrobiia bacterium]
MNFFPSRDAAVEFVTAFLRLVEHRDLDEASLCLSQEVKIIFPGRRRFTDLHEQVASSRTRFITVQKEFERFDVIDNPHSVVVYAIGELSGTDAHGREFSGVRFIDRFTIIDGLITEHTVWNDFAAAG